MDQVGSCNLPLSFISSFSLLGCVGNTRVIWIWRAGRKKPRQGRANEEHRSRWIYCIQSRKHYFRSSSSKRPTNEGGWLYIQLDSLIKWMFSFSFSVFTVNTSFYLLFFYMNWSSTTKWGKFRWSMFPHTTVRMIHLVNLVSLSECLATRAISVPAVLSPPNCLVRLGNRLWVWVKITTEVTWQISQRDVWLHTEQKVPWVKVLCFCRLHL